MGEVVNNQIIGDRDTRLSPLSPEDLAVLRDSLHEQRLFREEQLLQIANVPTRTDEPVRGGPPRRPRCGSSLAASARMVLADVEAALERMAEGRYGPLPPVPAPPSTASDW